MDKTLIKKAPIILCQLLSPYTTEESVKTEVICLTNNPLLLEKVIECANRHLVATTLYARLHQANLLQNLPTNLLSYLQVLHSLQQERNQRLKLQLQSILKTLNKAGLTPLLLKGSDTLCYELYPSIGSRFMSDLDILMPEGSIPIAKKLLFNQGYVVPEQYTHIPEHPNAHHAPPIYKARNDCAIELHYKPLNYKSGNILSTNEAFKNGQPINNLQKYSLNALTLSPTHKVLHCFIHSEISHGYANTDTLDIRQMDYFVRLTHYYNDKIDWKDLENLIDEAGFAEEWATYHYKARQLFDIPKTVQSTHINEAKLEQRYQSALMSAMSLYYPWRRLKLGLKHLANTFSRERLKGQFTINGSRDHFLAIAQRLHQLIRQYILSPVSLIKRLKSIIIYKRT